MTRRKMMTLSIIGIVGIFALSAVLSACASMGAAPKGERLTTMKESGNYKDGKFVNAQETQVMLDGTFWKTVGEWFNGDQVRVPESEVPLVEMDADTYDGDPPGGFRVTWMGHNTVLVEMQGAKILTDPVFSKRVSPLKGVGPKRFHPSPMTVEALPFVDVVVISHDHYDHLDKESVQKLEPKTGVFVVPLGVGAHLERWKIPAEKIVEMDWWQSTSIDGAPGLEIACAPARHFSGRGLANRDETLWASFAFIGEGRRVYFGGDTGMHEGFAEIGERLGPFDVTLMPIGAYGPSWPSIHMDPEEAIEAHERVGGDLMIPIHWGTFNLAYHSWTEPAQRLLVAARKSGAKIAVPRPGEAVTDTDESLVAVWWPDVPWEATTPALAEASD